MFSTVFKFEVRQQFRKPFTWIFLLLMVLQGVYYMHHAGEYFSADKTFANAPAILYTVMAGLGYIGFIVTAILGGAALGKDLDSRTTALLYTTGVRQSSFFWGRYTGSLLTLLFLYGGYLVGILLYNLLPVPNLGPFSGGAFLKAFVLIFLPNVIVLYSLCFAVSVFMRSGRAAYGVAMAGMLLMIFGETTFDSEPKGTLLDPTGFSVLHYQLLHLSPEEKNVFSPEFAGLLLYNRLIWGGVSLVAVLWGYRVFAFRRFGVVRQEKEKGKGEREGLSPQAVSMHAPVRQVTTSFSSATDWKHTFTLSWLAFKSVVRPIGFRLFLFFIFVIYIGYMVVWQEQYYSAAPTLPVTVVITGVTVPLSFYLLLFIIINTTELLFRQQASGFWQIGDALPIPSWVNILSKVFAMLGVVILMTLSLLLFGIIVQVCKGYYHFELAVYFDDLFIRWMPKYIGYILLTVFVAGVTSNRYATHWICILFLVISTVLHEMEVIEQSRLNFIFSPGSGMHTDMNGMSFFGLAHGWYMLYWCALALALFAIGVLVWQRGTPVSLITRMRRRRQSPVFLSLFVIGIGLFFFSGNKIYETVNVQNKFQSKSVSRAEQVLYERMYKKYEHMVQPQVQEVQLDLNIYPADRKLDYSAVLLLRNPSNSMIDTLHLEWMDFSAIDVIRGARLVEMDTVLRHAKYVLDVPLQPHDSFTLLVSGHQQYAGFTNSDPQAGLTFNGSFITEKVIPHIGYDKDRELIANNYREQLGLAKMVSRIPPVTDTFAAKQRFASTQGDDIRYVFNISTAENQTIVAPGILEKQWTEKGRNHYRFVSEGIAVYDFRILSAAYAMEKDTVRVQQMDPGSLQTHPVSQQRDTVKVSGHPVVIEVYYHPGHSYNIRSLLAVAHEALGTLDTILGPYPYTTLRIAEKPHYNEEAYAAGNIMVLPENHGWIADIRRQDDLDYLRFITTKLIAEQYMQQGNISHTAGYPVLTHSVPGYLALLQLAKYNGKASLQRHLEKDRDNYLKGRAADHNEEPSLLDADEEAAYVYDEKGGAVLYQLSEVLGQDVMNSVVAELLQLAKGAEKPVNVMDFYRLLEGRGAEKDRSFLDRGFRERGNFNMQ
ncbi:hypothetical protein SIO70_17380 [Chitinophaga sancti]|uniref:hypothetical protein n=1 Tax=Chitinophaga sancti TaxID=1004 RepID=UPI002A75C645|nr:hypothetical protein [Chitinophaga sancti]WPQ60117.1 hypothetical protein SIO70_17380 [Chitinophaga sancti]